MACMRLSIGGVSGLLMALFVEKTTMEAIASLNKSCGRHHVRLPFRMYVY